MTTAVGDPIRMGLIHEGTGRPYIVDPLSVSGLQEKSQYTGIVTFIADCFISQTERVAAIVVALDFTPKIKKSEWIQKKAVEGWSFSIDT